MVYPIIGKDLRGFSKFSKSSAVSYPSFKKKPSFSKKLGFLSVI